MLQIPDKCMHWKMANSILFRWWCLAICGLTGGRLTGGRLWHWWCRITDRYGMWTLIVTLGIPIGAVVWVLVWIT